MQRFLSKLNYNYRHDFPRLRDKLSALGLTVIFVVVAAVVMAIGVAVFEIAVKIISAVLIALLLAFLMFCYGKCTHHENKK